jgi:hypothetical protein
VSDLLKRLNEVRKDVHYGEADSEQRDIDLEELVSSLETFVNELDALLEQIAGGVVCE